MSATRGCGLKVDDETCYFDGSCDHGSMKHVDLDALMSLYASCEDSDSLKAPNELSVSTRALSEDVPALSSLVFEEDDDYRREVEASWGESTCDVPLELGRPDGSTGGFYGVMRETRNLRAKIVERLLQQGSSSPCVPEVQALSAALATLRSMARPCGWKAGDDDSLHVLLVDSLPVCVRLGYEKSELIRDLRFLEGGEGKLLDLLREEHTRTEWLEAEVPSWEDSLERALAAMRGALSDGRGVAASGLRFRNMITDRDGTINNYCDRYPSSVQSIYNSLWLGSFARGCTDNTIIITAAPVGGRSGTEGLMELCTMPRDFVRCAGSKGREYYDPESGKVLEIEPLPAGVHDLLDQVHSRISSLCAQPENAKFLGMGSGLQRKFGEITVARNDVSKTVDEAESHRFMGQVRCLVEEVDREGDMLDMQDTGSDLEIFPRRANGQPCFTKGDGVMSLDRRLSLQVAEGPNLICGDTPSDVPMIEAALSLMSTSESDGTLTSAGKLAVLFVVTPEQHRRTPDLAETVRSLCSDSGARCAILPSPDALIAALARFQHGRPVHF
mmetsp:Transcript_14886/g.42718  ORF Transcript_14886/g.42718 Transcript_14886/m.42718 type:complete len:558 (+) Transcript_14886:70-1743(+)